MSVGFGEDRLLAFDLAGAFYALPIGGIAEVVEIPKVVAVPMLSRDVGGVVNHHGDALPVVFGEAIFESEERGAHQHLLVLARDLDDPNRYGLPVERIHGLVDGSTLHQREAGEVVVERRPYGERLMLVLDPKELLKRAASTIESSMAGRGPIHGGES